MTYLQELAAIRDRYVQMLADRQGLPGMTWPEAEEFLRRAILELNQLIAAGDAAAFLNGYVDTEQVTRGCT